MIDLSTIDRAVSQPRWFRPVEKLEDVSVFHVG
jgi:hypothetical protein